MEREHDAPIGRLIARLAAAVIAADHRITSSELASSERLDRLNLGALGGILRDEIERAVHAPIDVAATCAALPRLGDDGAALVLTALADLVASDRVVALRERDVFFTIARDLGVAPAQAARILDAAISPDGRPETVPTPSFEGRPEAAPFSGHGAFLVLGLEPGASRSRIETTYREALEHYDPLRMARELGPDFAALAVRRLAKITDAYEAALDTRSA
jgi:DnaJ-domain-containing protein 1